MKTFESANNHPIFNTVLDLLAENQFYRELNLDFKEEISEGDLKKSAWIASILALSKDENMQSKALAFGILALLGNKDDPLFVNYCYIIISRTGNHPLSIHLKQIIDENLDRFNVIFDDALNLELGLKRALSKIELTKKTLYGSSFQKKLWDSLNTKNHLAISAPTSSGKSFLVQNYIAEMFKQKDEYTAVYIVPTRALIYEVSSLFKELLKDEDVIVKTGFSAGKEEIKTKELFVLTPERALKIVELNRTQNYEPNILFFDEIQNMEQKERGVLFEYVFNELAMNCDNTKIIIAGPFLKKLNKTFKKISGKIAEPITSMFLSVYQTKSVLRFKKELKNNVEVLIKSPSGKTITKIIPFSLTLFGKIKNSKPQAISLLVSEFAPKSQNIIYSNRKDSAETWAIHLSDLISLNNTESNQKISELIEYLSEEVHPNYALIRCLKKRVAFHHSCVPEIARMEIEELYRDEEIRHIVCTPTLVEGVNLPAEKLFMITNKKSTFELDDFEFGNLIGRTGRTRSHISGSIYCIERDDDMWGDEKFSSDFTKEITPATTKAFQEYKEALMEDISKPTNQIDKGSVAYTITLLRHKYLKHSGGTYNYLKNKGLKEDEIRFILGKLNNSLKDLSIPIEIINLNPTVDPLLQEGFFKVIKSEGIEKWLITKHPYANKLKQKQSEKRELPFEEKDFYFQFEEICMKMELLFDVIKVEERNGIKFKKTTIPQLMRYTVPWLQGLPYKKIVARDLKDKEKDDYKKVDSAIRRVTDRINTYARFELVKYYKLWADIISHFMTEEEIEKRKYFLNLPQMLEMGSCDPKALELMNEGVNRSVANLVAKKIPKKIDGSVGDWLKNNSLKMPNIFLRHLHKSGF